MSNRFWFEEPSDPIAPCEDCVDPNACGNECVVQGRINENVAAIRGENE
jgi:hypothetical protein